MSLSEHIKDLENTRAAKVGRLEELTGKSIEEGRSLDASETEEFDGLDSEIKQIDEDLVRYRSLEKMSRASASPVYGDSDSVDKIIVKQINLLQSSLRKMRMKNLRAKTSHG